ncbi:nucleotidyltransferase family protein [Spirulina sp. 06S082]|uniref:nucleotidyltransferase domain-containing protein n=1 Tax=Spirulina sp. 06S082 TaxID=3110248 RepID=UPI002B20A14A|nr:nucleotidyltransferase family protein [Spirulina sp. 06S082]MEA5469248.1 nucleotidyltransferase family protein [Spirulina sp. 06S082]
MTPEIELLLYCSPTQITSQQEEKISQLLHNPALNWQMLLDSAHYHNIAPLLYWTLNKLNWEGVPEAMRSQLSLAFQANLSHNFLVTSTLVKVCQYLQDKNLSIIPFKGSLLATRIYNNIALRRIRDVDLLVKKEDFFQVKQLLIEQGYYPYDRLNLAQEKLRLQTNYEDALVNSETGIKIDIHWGFHPPYFACNIPIDDIFQRGRMTKISTTELLDLAAEDLLLVLCLNGAKDGWFELQRVCDIAELLQQEMTLNWQELWQRARQFNCARILLLGLELARIFLHSSIPENMIEEIEKDRTVKQLSTQIYQRLVNNTEQEYTLLQRAYFPLQLQRGLKNKLYYSFNLLLPINERDLELIILPRFLFCLYYPLRFIRLPIKYGYAIARKAMEKKS